MIKPYQEVNKEMILSDDISAINRMVAPNETGETDIRQDVIKVRRIL